MASKGVNKVILVGNLGKDPETKYLPSGGAVTNLVLATSDSWKDKNTQEVVEKTEWHRVVMFNRLAEICGEYLKKGSKVYIEGCLQTRKWQDKEGNDKYTTEVVAKEMQMLDSKGQGDGGQGGGFGGQNPAGARPSRADVALKFGAVNPQAAQGQEAAFDDDIPF